MKLIDFKKKGNVVRFLLGNDDLEEWYGDDWDDKPYEHNAGTVYDEFVSGHIDVAFSFDDLVLEPCEDYRYGFNSPFSKDDMAAARVPCIVVAPKGVYCDQYDDCFSYWAINKNAIQLYFGESLLALIESLPSTATIIDKKPEEQDAEISGSI